MVLTQERIGEIQKQIEGLSEEEQQEKIQEIIQTLSPEEREQLVGKQECPFCLMVKGDIPTKKVYEDDKMLAILDIRPASKGHVLLFPKEHYRVMSTVPEAIVGELFKKANAIATAIFDSVQAQGTNIFLANGPVAGQTAPHVLINIIPRFQKDGISMAWNSQKVEESELETLAEIIRKKIPKEKLKVIATPQEIINSKEEFPRIP